MQVEDIVDLKDVCLRTRKKCFHINRKLFLE